MVDWPIFVIGLMAVFLVTTAVRAISREDAVAREDAAARRVVADLRAPTPPELGTPAVASPIVAT